MYITYMDSLYLTASEQKLFDALNPKLKEGWTVASETLSFEDTSEKSQIRFDLMRLEHPLLEQLRKNGGVKSAQDLADFMQKNDLSKLGQNDLSEILYVLGPNLVSAVIETMFTSVHNDDDLAGICAFTSLRHILFSAMQPTA